MMNRKKIVAGLDLSLTQAGVAIMDGDNVHCFSIGYKLPKERSHADETERTISITNSIIGKLKQFNVDHIGIEGMSFNAKRSGYVFAMQAELNGVIRTQLRLALARYPILIPPAEARKYVLGKNTSDKKKIRAYLASLGYYQPRNTDESDALLIALVINDWANNRSGISTLSKIELFDRIDYHQNRSVL